LIRKEIIWIDVAELTPLGPVWVAARRNGIIAVEIQADPKSFEAEIRHRFDSEIRHSGQPIDPPIAQIKEYLHGVRTVFRVKIDWSIMSPFQKQVLQRVAAIPYGQVTTYGKIARQIGRPSASRAVGQANGRNPIPLIIPCHRVIGADGNLRGYGAPGGVQTKRWLLDMEQQG
jgi:methylated-DNA-[protein]-cysteine S-methyltransferase